MAQEDIFDVSTLPSLQDMLAHPDIDRVREYIAKAEAEMAVRPADQRQWRIQAYHDEVSNLSKKSDARWPRLRRHKSLLEKQISKKPLNWLLGRFRRRAINTWMQRYLDQHSEADHNRSTQIEKEFLAEKHMNYALSYLQGITNDTVEEVTQSLSTSPNLTQWVKFGGGYSWLGLEISNTLWRELGLDHHQQKGGLINPQHMTATHITDSHGSRTEIRIESEPDYDRLLRRFSLDLWPQQRDIISRIAGVQRIDEIEDKLQSMAEKKIQNKYWSSYEYAHPYQMALYFCGEQGALQTAHNILVLENFTFPSEKEEFFQDMRQTHAIGGEWTASVEKHLTHFVMQARARPMNKLSSILAERALGQEASRWDTAETCLTMLEDLAPEKAADLARYSPIRNVAAMADDLAQAPLAALYAIPDEDRTRALSLLDHFKFASSQATQVIAPAIGLLSLTAPLQTERMAELRTMANAFLDLIDTSKILELAPVWADMPLEDKRTHILDWHEKACAVFDLPLKDIVLVDANRLNNEKDPHPTLGTHSHNGPITLAVASDVSLTQVIVTLGHETYHEENSWIEEGITPARSAHDTNLFQAQKHIDLYDPRTEEDASEEQKLWTRELRHALYRTRLSERESHFLDQCISERLRFFIATHIQGHPATAYLTGKLKELDVPAGKLLALADSYQETPYNGRAETMAKLDLLAAERPVFDISIAGGRVHILPLVAYPVKTDILTIHHARAMQKMGKDTIRVRLPTAQETHLRAALESVTLYQLPPTISAPTIPHIEEVFGHPSSKDRPLVKPRLPAPLKA